MQSRFRTTFSRGKRRIIYNFTTGAYPLIAAYLAYSKRIRYYS